MNNPEDVLRSLRRYVSQMLGSPPWTVRLQRSRIADDERPVAVIEESGAVTTPHSRMRTLNQGDVQKEQSYTVVCYPELGPQAAESRELAGRLRSLLDAGFTRGLVTDDDPPANIGAPFAFPVYDFDGVPISGEDRAGPDGHYAYANIDTSFNVRAIQDAVDELRFTVVANLRCRWWQAGRIAPRGPIAEELIPAYNVVDGEGSPGVYP